MRKRSVQLAADDVELLLGNWQRLNADILQLSEAAVAQLLRAAIAADSRPQVKLRIYHRFSRIRKEREQRSILRGVNPWQS